MISSGMISSSASSVDPNLSQKLAADPRVSAWVSASAGTGKTKVLTDRLLNLMLTGTDPQKILCLTFTKAAAAEMKERLFGKLRQWVLLSEADLRNTLQHLTSEEPTPALMVRARSLFTHVLDIPHGMKIMTIHGFCQTILGRFPLEAQISPHFSILDEGVASVMLRQASRSVFSRLSGSSLNWGVSYFFRDMTFQDALEELLGQRPFLRSLVQKFGSVKEYAEELHRQLDLDPTIDLMSEDAATHFLEQNCYDLSFNKIGLLTLLQEQPDQPLLAQWLEATPSQRVALYNNYTHLYLTQKGTILKKLKVDHEEEAQRLYRLNERLHALETAQKTLTLYAYGQQIFEDYQELKQNESVLDYDDLIEKTIHLLQTPETASWVLYKLDGGIDHILIDEAQDTNPHQWQVILKLAEDLFRPDKSHRTLFVVGDAKQSIYSFQGAKPEDFVDLRDHFSKRSHHIGQTWRDVDLCVSFRSTQEVLSTVDELFSCPTRQQKLLSPQKIVHFPHRRCLGGKVSLWPLVLKSEKDEEKEPWSLPLNQQTLPSPQQILCERIASQISVMLQEQVILPSTGRPIEPRDILILLKQRGNLALDLIRELKKRHIPVSGADRFLLMGHIAAQDLAVLGEFLLQPLNDLALATVLRSPLIGMNEQDLEDLCYGREEKSLWKALLSCSSDSDQESYTQAAEWLKKILAKQDYLPPYELYHFILFDMEGKKKLLSRLSLEAEDALTEFLNQALLYEHQGPASLQGFLGYLQNNPIEIKRDGADQQLNQVRIMTIHGSKGLQAPVVILPEKIDGRDKVDKLLWSLDSMGQPEFMLARPPIIKDSPLTEDLKQKQQWREEAEDMRLLYVALTRAQDHLYVCGYANGKGEDWEDSWYGLLFPVVPTFDAWQEEEDAFVKEDDNKIILPEYFQRKIKIEAMPSLDDISEEEEQESICHDSKVLNPEAWRGIIIHKLLEELAAIPAHQREETARILLKKEISAKSEIEWAEEAIHSSLSILTQFSDFFGKNSVSEVEIMSSEGKLMRLDRVCFAQQAGDPLRILDYKTTHNPPVSADQISSSIRQQLQGFLS